MNFDLIWPHFYNSLSKNEIKESMLIDVRIIKSAGIKKNSYLVLDEARRLYSDEQDRRNSADGKAGVYLSIVAGLVAFFSSLTPVFEIGGFSLFSIINYSLSFLFFMAILQLLRSGFWSLKAIKVKGYAILHWKSLLELSQNDNFEESLIKKIFCSLRYNYDLNNEKISKVNMAHATLISSVFWLALYTILKFLSPLILYISSDEVEKFKPVIKICRWCGSYFV